MINNVVWLSFGLRLVILVTGLYTCNLYLCRYSYCLLFKICWNQLLHLEATHTFFLETLSPLFIYLYHNFILLFTSFCLTASCKSLAFCLCTSILWSLRAFSASILRCSRESLCTATSFWRLEMVPLTAFLAAWTCSILASLSFWRWTSRRVTSAVYCLWSKERKTGIFC